MAATTRNNQQQSFLLSPHQQNLLFAALNSNKVMDFDTMNPQSTDGATITPLAFDNSPLQQTPVSGNLNGFDDSPYLDYDYQFDGEGDFGDYDFSNVSQGQMIGNLPGSASSDGDNDGAADSADKRSHPDDDEDDEDGGGKRREGDEKQSKKPGRKPLTSEPTSKRKAQNRAAQRAFRERKEKHLKDLETKVQDLEKASEAANHENALLRAQVEKMSVELKEYRKRLSSNAASNGRAATMNGALPSYLSGRGLNSNAVNNPNDVNFQFEFPKFGRLPGPPVLTGSPQSINAPPTASPTTQSPRGSNATNGTISPLEKSLPQNSFSSSNTNLGQTKNSSNGDIANFSGLFTPSSLDAITKDASFDFTSKPASSASRTSFDSANQSSSGQNTSHSSPASLSSNNGLTSSCGTSPEPASQSPPAFKGDNALGTIGEEHPSTIQGTLATPGFDINGIDWLAQQNGNQFDPQLFGDYRESQDSILSTGFYDDTFFNEAFAMPDFSSPFALEATSPGPKKDLVQEIDAKLNEEDEVVPGEAQMLTCTNMWEKIQACPRDQNGEIDMDSLCSQLQAKAKCSGDGPVIQESDFKEVLHSMFKDKPATAALTS